MDEGVGAGEDKHRGLTFSPRERRLVGLASISTPPANSSPSYAPTPVLSTRSGGIGTRTGVRSARARAEIIPAGVGVGSRAGWLAIVSKGVGLVLVVVSDSDSNSIRVEL
jgi:hypothetical protein